MLKKKGWEGEDSQNSALAGRVGELRNSLSENKSAKRMSNSRKKVRDFQVRTNDLCPLLHRIR